MGRRHSRRLCRDAGFRVYRRLRSAITLANQSQSHLVSDRIFKNPIAVQSGFSEEELFPLRTASRVHFSPVGIHPRRAWRSQILIMFSTHVILSEAKDLSQSFGSHKHSRVSRAPIVRFLAPLGMTAKRPHGAHKF